MKKNGFTLVELAIVLMIVGLLIGGVLRGRELLANSEATATLQQVKSYHAAFLTFVDKYNSYPGDMPNASQRLPGCATGNANNCINGNGDSQIGTPIPGYPWGNINPAITSENAQFWKMLALSHFISGVDPSAATPEWGKTNPTAKTGGGFFVTDTATANGINGVTFPASHLFVLRNSISGQWVCGNAGGTLEQACAISPQRASQIDRKIDDGIAYSGDVWSVSSNSASGCGYNNMGDNSYNGYNEGKAQPSCEMMFRFQ